MVCKLLALSCRQLYITNPNEKAYHYHPWCGIIDGEAALGVDVVADAVADVEDTGTGGNAEAAMTSSCASNISPTRSSNSGDGVPILVSRERSNVSFASTHCTPIGLFRGGGGTAPGT